MPFILIQMYIMFICLICILYSEMTENAYLWVFSTLTGFANIIIFLINIGVGAIK